MSYKKLSDHALQMELERLELTNGSEVQIADVKREFERRKRMDYAIR